MSNHDLSSTPIAGELAGRTAMVTGASSGIGRAIALELAAAGATVLLHGRTNRKGLNEVTAAINDSGRAATAYCYDLVSPEQQDALVQQVWAEHPNLDVWINNAGADVLTGAAADWPFEKKLERLWRVDVMATIRLSRLVGQRMRQRETTPHVPVVLNVGWDQADWGMGGDSGELFSATKGAIMAFSKSLAKSLAPHVRVNCIAPGWIRTSWGTQAPAHWQQRANRECLLGRWGQPEDVARAARFLVSPAAAFITGQVMHVNGGFNHGGRDA